MWKNSKTQILTKLKKSNCDKTKKKLWQNSKIQIGKKIKLEKQMVTKLIKSNCDQFQKLNKSNCDNTQKLKLWQKSKIKFLQNSKTHIVTVVILTVVTVAVVTVVIVTSFSKDTSTTDEMFSVQLLPILAKKIVAVYCFFFFCHSNSLLSFNEFFVLQMVKVQNFAESNDLYKLKKLIQWPLEMHLNAKLC